MKKFSYFAIILYFLNTNFVYAPAPKIDLTSKFKEIARKIVAKMSDKDKAGQVIHIAIPSKTVTEEIKQEIKKIKPGGIIVFGKNLGTREEIIGLTKNLQKEMKKLKKLPLFISIDQEGGRVVRVQKAVTEFPGAMALGQTQNPDNAYKVGFITSYELRKLGINLLFAPVMDINNNPDNPVINTRSFGSSLETVTELACAYERGARIGGAVPVIKHFPGHGDTNIDSHLGLPVINKSLEELEQFELRPFQKSIQDGAKVVMTAHIVYPKLDKDYPTTLSKKILNNILREKLKFRGVIITDSMEMDAIDEHYAHTQTAKLAILSGADIILSTEFGKTPYKYYKMILKAIKKKEFDVGGKNLLDEALIRQIALKLEYGLLHQKTSYIKIKNKEVNDFVSASKRERDTKYKELQKEGIGELNQKISGEAIKTYKKAFTPFSKAETKSMVFYIKNQVLKSTIQKVLKKKLKFFSSKDLKKYLKKHNGQIIVLGTREEKDVKFFYKLAKKYKKNKFLLLHYGSPFFKFPTNDSVNVIFSFSPTTESLKQLAKVTFTPGGKEIQSADLILK
ncbi:MAG: glycoside hydrolase family 3 protein [Leptospiraceae bacterium]|nr:glycoside hydrolase family 3 protein [Leptospiraceae bacterium]MCP5497262.1 glycoside hydrolase family 3 protein [Leptospiraceae bacterium]